jgi:hypothetical protein
MKPADFGARETANQDALFLIDEPDVCGTDALDGYGFGATFWAEQPEASPAAGGARPDDRLECASDRKAP